MNSRVNTQSRVILLFLKKRLYLAGMLIYRNSIGRPLIKITIYKSSKVSILTLKSHK
jgi:hypothetical protein